MFDTSKDIFWIVLAASAGVLTVFLAWIFFQVGRLLRQSNEVVEDVRTKLNSITHVITSIGDKVSHSAATITTVAKGLEQVLSFVRERKRNSKSKRKTEIED